MKKIFFILIAAAGFFSCSDGLDLEPIDQLTGSNFPQTDADVIAAVNGIYQANELSTRFGYAIDLTSDLTVTGENPNGDAGFLSSQQWEPFNSYITYMWETFYAGITNANVLIDNLEDPSNTITPSLKTRLIGEAKFLRAYYYQYAVQFWGEVPLVLHKGVNDEGDAVSRAPIDEVYTQIEADLIDAAVKLPHAKEYSGSDKGRATWGAAKTLLSKVYLVWGQTSPTYTTDAQKDVQKELYKKSIDITTEVIKSGDYALEEEYGQNWSVENRNGKESIFSTQHSLSQSSDGGGGNHLLHCAFSTGFTQTLPHVVISDKKFYEEFDEKDQRRGITYVYELYDPLEGKIFKFDVPRYLKYIDPIDPNGSASNRNIDRTILRYAEVFLLRAEASNEYNNGPNDEAYSDINTVRHRAFNKETTPSDYYISTGLNYGQFKAKIQQERVFELTYEQNRRLDLLRWKILVKTLKASGVPAKQNVSEKNYRFPIPGSQRNINPTKLWQNWGYDGYDEAETGINPYAGWE
ncbi:RagB/SusD family nutrient uptake outer membrane protein [termite gut metagenome]|uniref:RagB/SusD family nutrient uptake outer membrane protein n=1 Tax=termite gut metagenome TaxID=433724 RepID=A0A5J4R426_9ZZZZ